MVEEFWAHLKMAEEDHELFKEESWREGITVSCPGCEAPLAKNVKFSPECGAKLAPGAKFCGEYGSKAG